MMSAIQTFSQAATYTEDGLRSHALELLLCLELAGTHLRLELLVLCPGLLQFFLQFRYDLVVSYVEWKNSTDRLLVSLGRGSLALRRP